MKKVYGYIRVSDIKQKEGVSLIEQKRIIKEFAEKNQLHIIHFYEENKTAAKKGRPLFDKMLRNLKDQKAEGVIIHKIDRSARNLHDWADIGDLIDMDIDVFFAHESLNMKERGGRLSADIQAVMASDYVRNLRQETIKGLYGRLKQGYYPWRAPVGYEDNGKGKVKTPHPIQSELVKQLFALYASEEYNVKSLSKEMEKRGLRNKVGRRVCKNGITKILKNPFYIGLIKVKDKIFTGNHEPIIDPRIFNLVKIKIQGRISTKGNIHNHLFRRHLRCGECNYIMPGEKQKGHIYYRCQTKGCQTKTVREDTINRYVKNILNSITLTVKELRILEQINTEEKIDELTIQENLERTYHLQIRRLEIKEKKLIDMYLEDSIDKERYGIQREELLIELQNTKSQISKISRSKSLIMDSVNNFLELCKTPINIYDSGNYEEKRELLNIITSNLTVNQRKVSFTMVSPYAELANREILDECALKRGTHRTMYPIITYSDINTSPIIPKPMNKKQLRVFYRFLQSCAATLSTIKKLQNQYELSTDDTDS